MKKKIKVLHLNICIKVSTKYKVLNFRLKLNDLYKIMFFYIILLALVVLI